MQGRREPKEGDLILLLAKTLDVPLQTVLAVYDRKQDSIPQILVKRAVCIRPHARIGELIIQNHEKMNFPLGFDASNYSVYVGMEEIASREEVSAYLAFSQAALFQESKGKT